MAREQLKQKCIEDLRLLRKLLLDFPKEKLSYSSLHAIIESKRDVILRADNLSGGLLVEYNINSKMDGYQSISDSDLIYELRIDIIGFIDNVVMNLDRNIKINSVLEEYILKIKNIKLSQLLIEFNNIKDINPNLASIGFRTILCLVIRERAKIIKPHITLAKKDDLKFEPDINEAIKEHIFTSGEEKLLKTYREGGNKAKFDNVAHKTGDNMLMKKEDLEDAIDLLNTLLPSVVI